MVRVAHATRDKEVSGFHIAMDQAAGMRGVKRASHLRDQHQGALRAEATILQQHGLEIATRDVAHRQEHGAVHLARLVNRNHVRMLKRGRHPRLA